MLSDILRRERARMFTWPARTQPKKRECSGGKRREVSLAHAGRSLANGILSSSRAQTHQILFKRTWKMLMQQVCMQSHEGVLR